MAQQGNKSNVPMIRVRQKICIPFNKWGTCTYGVKCSHVHIRGKGKSRESSAIIIVNTESTDVPSQGIGQTKTSVDCKKLKTRVCPRWERDNRCSYGAKCIFAHGEAELKSLNFSNPPESRSSADISAPARNVESNETVTIAPADHRFKWNDIQWISRIYADWIE